MSGMYSLKSASARWPGLALTRLLTVRFFGGFFGAPPTCRSKPAGSALRYHLLVPPRFASFDVSDGLVIRPLELPLASSLPPPQAARNAADAARVPVAPSMRRLESRPVMIDVQ